MATKRKRIRRKMAMAVAFVVQHGGRDVPNHSVCNHVNPHPVPSRNEALGYDPVDRAVAAGPLIRTAGKRGSLLSVPA